MWHYSISKAVLEDAERDCRVRSNVTRIMCPLILFSGYGKLSNDKHVKENKNFNDVHKELILKSQLLDYSNLSLNLLFFSLKEAIFFSLIKAFLFDNCYRVVMQMI